MLRLAPRLAIWIFAFSTPVQAGIPATAFERLIGELDASRAEHGVPGFALAVLSEKHGLQTGVGGVADRGTGRPVTLDTVFRVGSITKTFNALAVLSLAEQGRLDLDAPLRTLVPDAPIVNPWADTSPVRIAHLLEHTSGLLDLTREEFEHNEPFPSLESALAWRPEARLVQWPPGLHSVYSNANAGLIGLVIEHVSGQSYERFVTEQLFGPLCMRSASLTDDEVTRKRLATGYDADGQTPIPYWHMIFPPLGAINANPREMGALLELFLRRGKIGDTRLLSAESIERMERPATTLGARHGLTYGYGPALNQSLRNGLRWYGHIGDGDGYMSYFGYNRAAQVGYFLTINAFKRDALAAMRHRVEDFLTRGVSAPQPLGVCITPDTLFPLVGTYVAVTRRFEWQSLAQLKEDRLQVVLEDGELFTRTGKGRRRLIPVAEHLFRREDQPLATIAIAAQDAETYLQAEFGNYRREEK